MSLPVVRAALLTIVVLASCGSPPRPAVPKSLDTSTPSPAKPPPAASAPRQTDSPSTVPEALFEGPAAPDDAWPRGQPAELGFDLRALADLVAEARRTKSDALLIIKDGKLVVERTFGTPAGPIDTMSVTKSVVSIAVGLLIDEGKIASVDAPLSTWFGSWSEGLKAKVTVRHVLTQTSGLRHEKGTRVLNQHDDRLKFVLGSPIEHEPGTRFSYNNEATLLLSGVIRAAAGKGVDAYLDEKLFGPLGITTWSWRRDPAGNVLTHAGLALSARDLAKIGQLMLDGGVWQGRRLLSEKWVTASTSPSRRASHYGYLWWLRHDTVKLVLTPERHGALRARGFVAADKLAPLVGRPLLGPRFWMEVGALLSAQDRAELARLVAGGLMPFEEKRGRPIAFAADGWLGQALIVSRPYRLIAVRQHRKPEDREVDEAYNQQYGFFSLGAMLKGALAPVALSP